MRLQKYNYELQYERGTNLYLADTLSRAYLPTTIHPTGAEFENINAAAFLPVSTSRLREIQQATEDDEHLQALKAIILRDWPDDRSQLPEQTSPYLSMRDELSLHDGVIFCDDVYRSSAINLKFVIDHHLCINFSCIAGCLFNRMDRWFHCDNSEGFIIT